MKTLSGIAIRAMFIRILIVVTVSGLLGYWYNYNIIRERVVHEIQNHVQQRSTRESLQFVLAEKNLARFASKIKEEIKQDIAQPKKRLQEFFKKHYDVQHYIPEGVELTDESMKHMIVGSEILQRFGFIWNAMFLNAWISGPQNYGLTYWPSRPNALASLPPDFSFTDQEYMQVGLPKNNPEGSPAWTGPYPDVMANDWLISLNHPIYQDGEYKFSIGLDILLKKFYSRVEKDTYNNSYNIVFDKNGRLIIHPQHMLHIRSEGGQFYIQESQDDFLKQIFHRVKTTPEHKVIFDEKLEAFIGIGKIKGPDWYLVNVYPQSNLKAMAFKTALFVIIMGLLTLIIEILMLYQVLQKYVTRPIKKLISATNGISRGNFGARVDIDQENELGLLAREFNVMADNIQQRDEELNAQANKLEKMVNQRTKELDLQRAKTVQSSKMATLGEIAGSIAHEINNPLTVIDFSADLIKKNINKKDLDKENILEYAKKINNTVARIARIIKGLKSFSRQNDEDPLVPTSLSLIIENVLALCEQSIKNKGITLELAQLPEANLICREADIEQVILNLLQNAIDALEHAPEKKISLSFEVQDKMISIMVEDSGPGIPKNIVDKIMNPFFTTKEVGKGTGLGLFISSGLIQSNKGELVLDSHTQGTRFIIKIPLA